MSKTYNVESEGKSFKFSEDKVEALTRKAEQGDPVSDELNKMGFQERLAMARAMDACNNNHRVAAKDQAYTIPNLEIVTTQDMDKKTHLTDIQTKSETGGKIPLTNIENPANPIHRDVYNLPQKVLDGNVERSLPKSWQNADREKVVLSVLDK